MMAQSAVLEGFRSLVALMTQENSKMQREESCIIGPDLPSLVKKSVVMKGQKLKFSEVRLDHLQLPVNQELSDVLKSNVRVILNFTWYC